MPYNSAQIARLEESVRENPANQAYYHAALSNAGERIPFDALADIVAATPAPATCAMRPKNAITNLVQNGALAQIIEVDGQPYAGNYEDLLSDESICAESSVVYYAEITEVGRALLEGMGAHARIDALFASKSSFLQGFLAVLGLCAAIGATPKSQIEQTLRDSRDALRIDERTGLETVSPSFYTTSLEDAGALMWAGGCWHITEAGAAALAKWANETDRGEEGTSA